MTALRPRWVNCWDRRIRTKLNPKQARAPRLYAQLVDAAYGARIYTLGWSVPVDTPNRGTLKDS